MAERAPVILLPPSAGKSTGGRRPAWRPGTGEYAAAWSPAGVPYRRRVTVRFVDGAGRTVSHWNKLLKGALVRHLLTERPAGPEELADWSHPSGYRIDGSRSRLADDPALAVFVQRS